MMAACPPLNEMSIISIRVSSLEVDCSLCRIYLPKDLYHLKVMLVTVWPLCQCKASELNSYNLSTKPRAISQKQS